MSIQGPDIHPWSNSTAIVINERTAPPIPTNNKGRDIFSLIEASMSIILKRPYLSKSIHSQGSNTKDVAAWRTLKVSCSKV